MACYNISVSFIFTESAFLNGSSLPKGRNESIRSEHKAFPTHFLRFFLSFFVVAIFCQYVLLFRSLVRGLCFEFKFQSLLIAVLELNGSGNWFYRRKIWIWKIVTQLQMCEFRMASWKSIPASVGQKPDLMVATRMTWNKLLVSCL